MPADRRRCEEILLRHECEAAGRSELNDGAEYVLAELKRRGLKLALLTRNCRESVATVLGIARKGYFIPYRYAGSIPPDAARRSYAALDKALAARRPLGQDGGPGMTFNTIEEGVGRCAFSSDFPPFPFAPPRF